MIWVEFNTYATFFAYDLFYLWVYWPSFERLGNLLHIVDCTDSHNVVQTHYKLLTYILMS